MTAIAPTIEKNAKKWLPACCLNDPQSIQKIQELQQKIYQYVESKGTPSDLKRLRYAFEDIAIYHGTQIRKSGEPVVIHPLRVAWSICDAGLDAQSVVAALLHDIIEDSEVSYDDVKKRYGKWYADVVDGLTKIKYPEDTQNAARSNLEATYQKMLVAMVKDVRALFIKLFDRLDNMRDLESMPRHKQRRISKETLGVYVPMARRLGLTTISLEHTELCFRFLYPKRYQQTLEQIEQVKKARQPAICKMQEILDSRLKVQMSTHYEVLPIYTHPASHISNKNRVDSVLEKFRILVDGIPDAYQVLGVLHTDFQAVPLSIRDFISNPRWNGYRALQTQIMIEREMVPIEVVPREMHALNEHGVMWHWKGTVTELSDYYQTYFNQLDELVSEDDIRVDDILRHVESEQIQVFTPDGDSYFFPIGTTVLDFAYQVHTELGDHCLGALINPSPNIPIEHLKDSQVPRRRVLSNGETVHILTDPHVEPTKEWLLHARTAKAQLNIKKSLKAQNMARASWLGEQLIRQKAEIIGVDYDELSERPSFKKALVEEGWTSEKLHELIGLQKLNIDGFFKKHHLLTVTDLKTRSFLGRSIARGWEVLFQSKSPDILIEDLNDTFLHFAECCQPFPNDSIIGFATDDHMLEVHRTNCPQVKQGKFLHPISVGWNIPMDEELPRQIQLTTKDEPGVLYQIIKAMNDVGVNIQDIRSESVPGQKSQGVCFLSLYPTSWKVYYKALSRLRTLKVVLKID